MTIPRLGLPSILLGLAFAGCGMDPLKELRHQKDVAFDKLDAAVMLATPKQVLGGEVVENSYIVTFRSTPGAAQLRFANYAAEFQQQYSSLAGAYLSDPRIADLNYITTVDLANPKDPAQREELAPPRALQLAWNEDSLDDMSGTITQVDFVNAEGAQSALTEWEQQGALWFAEPNYINTLMDSAYNQTLSDAYKSAAIWWHSSIKLDKALEKLAASPPADVAAPVVAVLDSGLDVQNEGIKDHVWINDHPGDSGCPGDINGCDTTVAKKKVLGSGNVSPYLTGAYGTACPYPDATPGSPESGEKGVCEHGTHVSGIIAASVGNGVGGVCPVCKIMMIKIIKGIKGKGQASDAAILNGFKYLTLFRASGSSSVVRVANSSFGKYVRARAVSLLVSVLKKPPNEILVVGAAGNEDSMLRTYPAALNDALAVSAIRVDSGKSTYSNFGPWVDIAAPGGDDGPNDTTSIRSTVPGPGGTGVKQGTSMACPVVAGVAGLVLSVDPGRSFSSLRSSLINTADPALYNGDVYGGVNRGFYYPKISGDNIRRALLGSGIIDALAALDRASKTTGVANGDLNRVNSGCGSIGTGQSGDRGLAFLWFLLLPLAASAGLSISRFSRKS